MSRRRLWIRTPCVLCGDLASHQQLELACERRDERPPRAGYGRYTTVRRGYISCQRHLPVLTSSHAALLTASPLSATHVLRAHEERSPRSLLMECEQGISFGPSADDFDSNMIYAR